MTIDVSKIVTHVVVAPESDNISVSKIVVNTLVAPGVNDISISKMVVSVIIAEPFARRRTPIIITV